jgi:hypothetical protein
MSLKYGSNDYYSNNHEFFDNSGNLNPPLHVGDWASAGASFYANAVTISPNFQVGTTFYSGTTGTIAIVNGSIRFPDGTTQGTAFNGTTSTNVTTIINQPAFRQVSKPASASAPGTPGDIFFSNTFIYLCVDTNTWKKIAIATGGLW